MRNMSRHPVSAAVPAPTETAAASAAIPDGEKININTASEQDLMKLEGIGKTLAKRIVERREQLGGYSVVEQLLEVKGIGEKLLQSDPGSYYDLRNSQTLPGRIMVSAGQPRQNAIFKIK